MVEHYISLLVKAIFVENMALAFFLAALLLAAGPSSAAPGESLPALLFAWPNASCCWEASQAA